MNPREPGPDLATEAEVIHPPSERKALEWIAALGAAGIGYSLRRHGGGWELVVRGPNREEARDCILAFEEANRGWPPRPRALPTEPVRAHPIGAGLWGCGFLVLVFLSFGPYDSDIPWLREAALDSTAPITDWWRPITALTLHSGFPHLAGNLIFLAVLGSSVCVRYGLGLGWSLILISGILGNLLTARLSDGYHLSVGASTACFGALGIVAMDQAFRNLRRSGHWRSIWSRAWIPLCGALAMLGFMGTRPGSDLVGHAMGFLAGLAVILPWTLTGRLHPGETVDAFLKVGSVVLVMAAWRAAIGAAG